MALKPFGIMFRQASDKSVTFRRTDYRIPKDIQYFCFVVTLALNQWISGESTQEKVSRDAISFEEAKASQLDGGGSFRLSLYASVNEFLVMM
jgi:hypothetical protein